MFGEAERLADMAWPSIGQNPNLARLQRLIVNQRLGSRTSGR
jgi:hypothetical protein